VSLIREVKRAVIIIQEQFVLGLIKDLIKRLEWLVQVSLCPLKGSQNHCFEYYFMPKVLYQAPAN
jgi:hypothetical protein